MNFSIYFNWRVFVMNFEKTKHIVRCLEPILYAHIFLIEQFHMRFPVLDSGQIIKVDKIYCRLTIYLNSVQNVGRLTASSRQEAEILLNWHDLIRIVSSRAF